MSFSKVSVAAVLLMAVMGGFAPIGEAKNSEMIHYVGPQEAEEPRINVVIITVITKEKIETAVRESVHIVPVPDKPECSRGDVNGDASIDIKDIVLILQILNNAAPQDKISHCGDVNNDGKIGLEELIYVLKTVTD
jgi:hypothetical protein